MRRRLVASVRPSARSTLTGPEATLLRRTSLRLGLHAALIAPAGTWLITRTPGGAVTATPGLPPGLPGTAALSRTARTGTSAAFDLDIDGREYRIQTACRANGTAVEGVLDLRSDRTEQNHLVAAMLVCGGLGLALAVAAGAWLGTRAVQPPTTLRRAVTALTDNAVRHARRSVTVSVTRQGPWVFFDVTDDGAGISPETAPRLLQRFVSTGDPQRTAPAITAWGSRW